jgi:hypothetical protein
VIPYLVTVCRRRRDGRWLHLNVPVWPVLLVLSPVLLLVVLGGLVACLVFRISGVAALRGLGHVVCALPGTQMEIEYGGTAVLVSVR